MRAQWGFESKVSSNESNGLVPFRQFPVIFNSFMVWTIFKEYDLKKLTWNTPQPNAINTIFDVELGARSFRNVRQPHVQVRLFPSFEEDALVAVLHLSNLR